MRTKNELIDLLIQVYDNYGNSGLCITINRMSYLKLITSEEQQCLNRLIDSYNPKQSYDIHGKKGSSTVYGFWYKWKPYAKSPRIKWLKSQKDTE